MARRTKEEAQETRAKLLDAAEHLFLKQGVSGTSLAQIAQAAGTTRGAIYWHFKDKGDLFNAMMDRITLPFEAAVESMMCSPDAIQAMRDHALLTMDQLSHDTQLQRVLTVAMMMVELVPEHLQIRERHEWASQRHIQRIAHAVREWAQCGAHELNATPEQIANGFHSLVFGLMYQWLLTPTFDLQETSRCCLDAFLRGAGLGAVLNQR